MTATTLNSQSRGECSVLCHHGPGRACEEGLVVVVGCDALYGPSPPCEPIDTLGGSRY